MDTVAPGQIVELSVLYMENGIPVSGLSDIHVEAWNQSGVKVHDFSLAADANLSGKYYFLFDTTSEQLGNTLYFYYFRGMNEFIGFNEIYFDRLDDIDGEAF